MDSGLLLFLHRPRNTIFGVGRTWSLVRSHSPPHTRTHAYTQSRFCLFVLPPPSSRFRKGRFSLSAALFAEHQSSRLTYHSLEHSSGHMWILKRGVTFICSVSCNAFSSEMNTDWHHGHGWCNAHILLHVTDKLYYRNLCVRVYAVILIYTTTRACARRRPWLAAASAGIFALWVLISTRFNWTLDKCISEKAVRRCIQRSKQKTVLSPPMGRCCQLRRRARSLRCEETKDEERVITFRFTERDITGKKRKKTTTTTTTRTATNMFEI